MALAGDIKPTGKALTNNSRLVDQGYTYNQAGLTYNHVGVQYGGFLYQVQVIGSNNITVNNVKPIIARISN